MRTVLDASGQPVNIQLSNAEASGDPAAVRLSWRTDGSRWGLAGSLWW